MTPEALGTKEMAQENGCGRQLVSKLRCWKGSEAPGCWAEAAWGGGKEGECCHGTQVEDSLLNQQAAPSKQEMPSEFGTWASLVSTARLVLGAQVWGRHHDSNKEATSLPGK